MSHPEQTCNNSHNEVRLYQSLPESDVIVLAKNGNVEAFGELYECHVNQIFSYFYYNLGRDTERAEDLAAKTFFRAQGAIGRYQERGFPFRAWLFKIARNLLFNEYRDRKRRKEFPMEELPEQGVLWKPPLESVEEEVIRREEQEQLRTALEQLKSDSKHRDWYEVIYLRYGVEMSNGEVGQIMGRSETAIKALVFRALGGLKKKLEGK